MVMSPPQFPEVDDLSSALAAVLGENGCRQERLSIVDRQPNRHTGRFSSEVVTCRRADGCELRLFCKHSKAEEGEAFGHRGGLDYEAEVYRNVLRQSRLSSPRFYGTHHEPVTGTSCLVLGLLEDAVSANQLAEPATAMVQAATWLGRFHASNEIHDALGTPANALTFLIRYDADYYVGWMRRAWQFSRSLQSRFPWLATLCDRFGPRVVPLLLTRPTVIHGEFYPKNVLVCGGTIYPVDWESAAIAAGEIDLAALIERWWPPELVEDCVLAYQEARWRHGSPADFATPLAAATVYLQFRWLGEREDWTVDQSSEWRFRECKDAAERLGLI